jgi:hypothetical protein
VRHIGVMGAAVALVAVAAHTAGTGSNSAAWSPDLAVAVPSIATATTYSGIVSHLVSGA